MKNNKIKFLILMSIIISSCETNDDKKLFGQIVGAAVGGYVGSKFGSGVGNQIATALGVAAGAVIATKLMNVILDEDRESYSKAITETLEENPNNIEKEWESPNETGTSAKIKPVNDFEKNGAPCRDFEQIITRDGKQYIEKSTACRDESGNWKIV